MRRTLFLSLIVFTLACTRLSAQNLSPESANIVNDIPTSGVSIFEKTLPMEVPMGAPDSFGLRDFERPVLPMPSSPFAAPVAPFVPIVPFVPQTTKFVRNGGYMPLVVKNNHTFGLTGSRDFYPSMGFSNTLSMGHNWALTDKISLYGGVYASDNMYHRSRFKDFGFSGRIRVQVADRVFLNGQGSYSVYNNSSGQLPPFMYPANSYGGSLEVKITDKFGLQGGAERGFNMFTRQWETSYYVLPVFY